MGQSELLQKLTHIETLLAEVRQEALKLAPTSAHVKRRKVPRSLLPDEQHQRLASMPERLEVLSLGKAAHVATGAAPGQLAGKVDPKRVAASLVALGWTRARGKKRGDGKRPWRYVRGAAAKAWGVTQETSD